MSVDACAVASAAASIIQKNVNVSASKAVRAVSMEATDYLACVMAERSQHCLGKYEQCENTRRQNGHDTLNLD